MQQPQLAVLVRMVLDQVVAVDAEANRNGWQ